MSKLKPDQAKSTYYWRSRYYPYHWWRRRYYPYYWWRRRWYSQPSESAQVDMVKSKPSVQSNNAVSALQEAFCLRLDTMFMVKALQYSRDNSPTDEDIYNLVDDMLEMYHAEGEMLDEDDFDEMTQPITSTQTTEPDVPSIMPPPPPSPSPAPEPAPEQPSPAA